MSAELVPLDERAARDLTEQIRGTLTVAHDLILEAWRGRVWLALGYESWSEYVSSEFTDHRMVRLGRDVRLEIVGDLHQAGMSSRAIAAALGVDQKTIINDEHRAEEISSPADVPEAPAAPVTGLDGKTYRRRTLSRPTAIREFQRARAEAYPELADYIVGDGLPAAPVRRKRPPPPRPPLPDDFRAAVWSLTEVAGRLRRLLDDDRFAEQVAHLTGYLPDLEQAADVVTSAVDRIAEERDREAGR